MKKAKIILICSLVSVIAIGATLGAGFGFLGWGDKYDDSKFCIYNLGLVDINNDDVVNFAAFGEYEGGWSLPAFWFDFVDTADVKIYAPCNGIVTAVREMRVPGDKWEIIIQPEKGSKWNVILMHFKRESIQVKVGDKVKVGDFLGKPDHFDIQGPPNTISFEIQITNNGEGSHGMHYASFAVFDSNTKSIYEDKITGLMSDLETRKSDSGLYDESAMVYPGCYNEKISE